MDKQTIQVTWMYPDILSLHGERGSVQAFEKVAENLKVDLKVTRIDQFEQKIDFENTDIMLFLPGELKVIPNIKEALEKQKEELATYLQNRKYIIAIGTTSSLLAKKITREDGTILEGLGILDMDVKERKMVMGDDLYFYIENTKQEIIGSQIQMVDIIRNHVAPLRIYAIWIWKLWKKR